MYFLEPKSIEAIKKVDPESPTLGCQAPKIFFGETGSIKETVPQETKTVKSANDIMPELQDANGKAFAGLEQQKYASRAEQGGV